MRVNTPYKKTRAILPTKKLLSTLAGAALWLMCSHVVAGEFRPANVKWSHLTFRTTILFFTLRATVDLQKLSPTGVKPALLPVPDYKAVMPTQDYVYLLKTHSAKFGRNSTIKFWFEGDLTPLQRTEIQTGRKNIVRTYRFLTDGAYRKDVTPTENEKRQPPEQWTNNSAERYPYPRDLPSLKMTDNAVIFYAVSAAPLNKKGDKAVFLTFDKKHINEVTLLCEGFADIVVGYKKRSNAGEKKVEGSVKALRISLRSKPLGKHADKKDFKFLGVKGNINIYLDPQSHIPLQVSGEADYVGHTDITLSRMTVSP